MQANSNSIGNLVKNFITSPSILNRLILINVVVFLLVNILKLFYFLGNLHPSTAICGEFRNEITYYLILPSNLNTLFARPWTVFSYMFLHEQFWHIFLNMFMLYIGGQMFVQFIGAKKLLSVYILGGLIGAAFYVIAFNVFPVFALAKFCGVALGASASVLAVFIAIATFMPNYNVMLFLIGKVQLKYIALIFVIIDLVSIVGDNPGGSIAHLGGTLWGFLFGLQYRKNSKSIFSFDFSKITSLFKRKKRKMRIDYSERPQRPLSDEEFNRMKAANQKRIDAILDKISQSGYKSLSAEEKEFLFKFGKRD